MKKLFFTLCALCVSVSMWALTTDNRYYYDTDRPTDESAIYLDETTGLYFEIDEETGVVSIYHEEEEVESEFGW